MVQQKELCIGTRDLSGVYKSRLRLLRRGRRTSLLLTRLGRVTLRPMAYSVGVRGLHVTYVYDRHGVAEMRKHSRRHRDLWRCAAGRPVAHAMRQLSTRTAFRQISPTETRCSLALFCASFLARA